MSEPKTDKIRKRTQARELALQALYMIDQRPELTLGEAEDHVGNSPHPGEVRKYAMRVIEGIMETRKRLDETIQSIAANWEIVRMPVVDRNILRLAAYEILYCEDIPRKVAINEAIDLAKKYSTKESGSFVNGILDKVKKTE